jgi:hypothetical protein
VRRHEQACASGEGKRTEFKDVQIAEILLPVGSAKENQTILKLVGNHTIKKRCIKPQAKG